MPHLHIANATHQNQQFHYRIPEKVRTLAIDIPAGRQVRIPFDLNEEEVAAVVAQLERFGAVPKSDVRAILRPRALLYSVDRKPIEADKLDEARERDEVARQEIAAEQTQNAGLALLHTATKQGNPNSVKATSLEVKQMTDLGEVKEGVNVEINVSKDAPGKMQTSKRV